MSATSLFQEAWPIPLAYLAGATPFGYLAGKLRGVDLRQHGSGNIGATNAIRVLGKPIGITVLLLDLFKGLLPVLLARSVSAEATIAIFTALAAILGHNYTFWLGFKGGKGIATTAGAILPLIPWALLAAVLIWLLVARLSRYVSVASIAAAITIPLALIVQSLLTARWEPAIFLFALFTSSLAIWKHRANIQRLRRGEENRIGAKPAVSRPAEDPSTLP